MKIIKRLSFLFLIITIVAVGYTAWMFYGSTISNPHNYQTIGDIPAPHGYKRISGEDPSYSKFLRSLPLRRKGAEVKLYTGGKARFQSLNYAVVDIPIISNAEQCADVCMRLRAEYLYGMRQYDLIHFNDVNGNVLRYSGGTSRTSFEKYLKKVYEVTNTHSLSRELLQRALKEMQPGDVFVYAAADRPGNPQYGHAIMVVDVAKNKDGEIAFMLAEGNTPARSIHVMRNLTNLMYSPWFIIDGNESHLLLSVFHFKSNELHHY